MALGMEPIINLNSKNLVSSISDFPSVSLVTICLLFNLAYLLPIFFFSRPTIT